MNYLPIKWLSYRPGCTVPTHPEVEQAIASHPDARGKNADNVRGEVLLAYRDAVLNDGCFSICQTRLEAMYNSRVRKAIIAILSSLSTDIGGNAKGRASKKRMWKTRLLPSRKTNKIVDERHFEGASENVQQYVQSLQDSIQNSKSKLVTVDNSWYQSRQLKWTELCINNPTWTTNYCRGASRVGAAVLTSLDDIALPKEIQFVGLSPDSLAHAQLWHLNFVKSGVSRHITRSHGRVYHPMLFSSKQIRRAAFLRVEPVAEVDLHATYICLLARKMKNQADKAALIDVLQAGAFYDVFEPIKNLKAEVQRQVMFPRDRRLNMRPLMRQLQSKLPGFAAFLNNIQQKLKTPTALASMLMNHEAEIFIDWMLLEFWDNGRRPVIPLHDGFLVRQSDAQHMKDLMLESLTYAFGFTPCVNIKYANANQPSLGGTISAIPI